MPPSEGAAGDDPQRWPNRIPSRDGVPCGGAAAVAAMAHERALARFLKRCGLVDLHGGGSSTDNMDNWSCSGSSSNDTLNGCSSYGGNGTAVVVIMRGIPGCGKSTITAKILEAAAVAEWACIVCFADKVTRGQGISVPF